MQDESDDDEFNPDGEGEEEDDLEGSEDEVGSEGKASLCL